MFIHQCLGCGRLAVDADSDLTDLKAQGHVSCCPERKITVRPVYGVTAKTVADAIFNTLSHLPDNSCHAPHIEVRDHGLLYVDGIVDPMHMTTHLLLGHIFPMGDNEHWAKMAQWRLQAANEYLMQARAAKEELDKHPFLLAEIARLRSLYMKAFGVLKLCSRVFREYAEMHAAKGKGHEMKVERNLNMAKRCDAACGEGDSDVGN